MFLPASAKFRYHEVNETSVRETKTKEASTYSHAAHKVEAEKRKEIWAKFSTKRVNAMAGIKEETAHPMFVQWALNNSMLPQ